MRRRDLIKKSTVPPSLAALRELIPKYIDLLQPSSNNTVALIECGFEY